MSEQRYQVDWPYATVKILDDAGAVTVVGFTKDAIVPTSADPEDVKRLLAKGALKKVTTAEPEPVKSAAKPEPKTEAKAETKPADSKAEAKAEPKSAKAG